MPTQVEYNGAVVIVDCDPPEDGPMPGKFISRVCEAFEAIGRHDLAIQFSTTNRERRPKPANWGLE